MNKQQFYGLGVKFDTSYIIYYNVKYIMLQYYYCNIISYVDGNVYNIKCLTIFGD